MDTDWCLGCDRHTTTDGQAYCSKTCMLIDKSFLPRPIPQRSASITYHPRPRPLPRRPHTTTEHHSARFHHDDLTWTGRHRAGILQWASSVHPGLEEEDTTAPIPYPENPSSPAVVQLQNVLFRPPTFPLTAQNLAPPCVTVADRHVTLHAPSLVSQDDSSLQTPATESVASFPAKPPFLDRIVSQVCSWVAPHPRASAEGNPSPPSDVVHSDETQRIPRLSVVAIRMPRK